MDETTTNATQQQNLAQNTQHMCPNCGYCPCCGRANARPYFAPYPYWPYWGQVWWGVPYQVTCGGLQQQQQNIGLGMQNNQGMSTQLVGASSLANGTAAQFPNVTYTLNS